MEDTFWEYSFSRLLSFKTHILVAVVSILLLHLLRSKLLSSRKLPPGPWSLPILGFLPFLSQNEPHYQLENLRKRYGDVFGLYLGTRYVVFIGDVAKSKEAMNMDEFTGRPDGAFPISHKNTHFGALYGNEWKERRKGLVQALRQIGLGSQMIQNVSREQINFAVKRIADEIGTTSSSGDVNVRPILKYTTITVVLKFVCGKTFSPDHNSYKVVDKFLKYFAEKGSGMSLDMVLPWAKPILKLSPYNKDVTKIFSDMENVIRAEVESHVRSRPENPKDLIDFYVRYYESLNVSKIPISDICGDTQIIVFGGSDTVRATTEWFLLCMAAHPEIQEKIFREIEDTLGCSGEVRYEDRHLLPYTEAAILECFRYKTLTPLNPYHSTTEDTKYSGYVIPKDSLVFLLLWTLHNDPAHWSHPNEFHPEHFLTPDKSKVQIPEAFVPFAPGKRTCPGDKMAMIEIYLFVVTLIQNFKILPPDGGVRMDGNLRISLESVYPIVKFMKRQSSKP